jgi:hypothetical protein
MRQSSNLPILLVSYYVILMYTRLFFCPFLFHQTQTEGDLYFDYRGLEWKLLEKPLSSLHVVDK